MTGWAGRRIKTAAAVLCAFFVLCGSVAGFVAHAEDGYTAEATKVYTHTLSDRAPVGVDPADILVGSVFVDYKRYEYDHPGSAIGGTQVDVAWELDGIDTSAPGVVEIPGKLQLPDWLYMPMENKLTFTLTLVETLSVFNSYNSSKHQLLEVGGNTENLASPATGTIVCSPRPYVTRVVPMVWHMDTINSSTPGRQLLRGEYLLPEGYVYRNTATGGRLYAEMAVYVYDPAAPPIFQVQEIFGLQNAPHLLVPKGATQQEVEALLAARAPQDIYILLNDDEEFEFKNAVRTDSAAIDTSAVGWQQAYWADILPCFDIPQRLMRDFEVYVIDPQEVDIRAARLDYQAGEIRARWMMAAENAEVWIKVDDGAWQQCADYEKRMAQVDADGTSFYVNIKWLQEGTRYLFELRYGPQAALRSTQLEVYYRDGELIIEGSGGDRDGGDRGEGDPPEIEQPAPPASSSSEPASSSSSGSASQPQPGSQAPGSSSTPSQPASSAPPVDSSTSAGSSAPASSAQSISEPAQRPQAAESQSESQAIELDDLPAPGGDMDGGDRGEDTAADIVQPVYGQASAAASAAASTPVYEVVNATTTSLSGLRLRELAGLHPQGVLFQKGGLSLWLDAAFLLGLDVADDALFTVTQTVHADGSFTIEVLVDGIALAEIPGTRLQLAWAAGQPLACESADGHAATDLAYSADAGLLDMTISHTGHYTVAVAQAPQSTAGASASAGHGALLPPNENDGGGWPPLGTLGIVLVAGAGGGTGLVLARRRKQR